MKPEEQIEFEENKIREFVQRETAFIQNKDINGLIPLFSADTLTFDVVDPLEYNGINEIRERMKSWFSSFDGPIGIEIHDLKVAASGNVAFSYCLRHVDATKSDGSKLQMWWRETTCYRKPKEGWVIVHRHSSVPFNPENGYASTTLEPTIIRSWAL